MNLRKLRQEQQLTQEELAKKLNITRTTYANYEVGNTAPDLKMLCFIADYFQVSIDYLLDHETENLIDTSNFTNAKKELINLVKDCNSRECEMLIAFLHGLRKG